MSQVIAGMYEIQAKIGAGGGGVVYLGRHLRLDKQVVLKADKRTLSTGAEVLRREVDMLKGLSHTYIPQVYDFVQEDGVVYTVMDFIEGESLDKLLAREQIPAQSQVIHWACQLLEALAYLHARPPHGILHGDIKPANIMLRNNGDICLIDYNIALALGEDGAVKVGFSRGYASPEHYGADYIKNNKSASVKNFSKQTDENEEYTKTLLQHNENSDETVTLADNGNAVNSPSAGKSTTGSTNSGKKGILLDVRSDIYSLGATLYHLLSGRRPARDALEVTPLGIDACSPAVSAIIQKAMAPDPAMRYQSADEMLIAFLQLHKRDKRVVSHRKHMIITALTLTSMFLIGGASSFIGLKQLEQRQEALTLAEYSANALAEGDVSLAVRQALQAIPRGKSILEAPLTAQAQKALTDALGVYDLSDGFKALDTVELPAVPFDLAVSPGGSRFAVVYAYEAAVYEMETQQRIVALPVQNSALSDCVFVDENHIAYAGDEGVTLYDLEKKEALWIGEKATMLAVSADGTKVAAVNRDENHAIVYQVSDGSKTSVRFFDDLHMTVTANDIFADPKNDIFALNEDGSLLAVSFSNGGLVIHDAKNPDGSLIVYEESGYRRFEGGFYGRYFAFAAGSGGNALFGLIDTEDAVYLGGYESQDAFLLQADKKGIFLANGGVLVSLEPGMGGQDAPGLEEKELAYTGNNPISTFSVGDSYVLAVTEDNNIAFYDSGANLFSSVNYDQSNDFTALAGKYAILGNRDEPVLRLLKLEDHSEAQLLAYDARYPHDEARISQDGTTAMLFSYQGFRIYDMGGALLTEEELPDAENIYDQQFVKEGEDSWLEVIWYDGAVRRYSASDGSLLSESQGERPNKDLYEEFYTRNYKIASSLHDAPQVYDLKTGRLVAALETDAYLTYVTEFGDYIITEYISTTGERYGILLDSKLNKLAYLPNLCDIAGDRLVFDFESGNLRQCRLYSLQELIALGETYIH